MASLQKNGDNYGLVWTDSTRRKSQVRESLKTDDKRKAQLKKKELEWKYAEGEHDPWDQKWYERSRPDEIFLQEAIKQYIKYKRNAKGKEGWGYRRYERTAPMLRHFAKFTGDMAVHELTEQHLTDYFYRPKVNSSHTRRTYRINLITFFKWCESKGYLDDYPDHELKPTKQKTPKFIYPDELAKLIQWKVDDVMKSVKKGEPHGTHESFSQIWMVYGWMILASTGMRPSELMRIKINHIGRQFINIGEDFDVKNAVERSIPILYEAKRAIPVLLKVRDKDRMMKDSEYLLGRPSDSSAQRMSKEFTRGWGKLFDHKRTLYNLKHTFAIRFLNDPEHSRKAKALHDLKFILGHKSITSTEIYTNKVPYGVNIEGTIWDVSLESE